jgi:DNA-binding transcriptional ArsR family regulator
MVLTEKQDAMDSVKILTGEDAVAALHALADESRRKILQMLRTRRMSTSELVEFLDNQVSDRDVKPQTVRYHLKELERCGLIQQDGYEPSGNGDSHIMTKLWKATAETVLIATGDLASFRTEAEPCHDEALELAGIMKQVGVEISDPRVLEDAKQSFFEWKKLWCKGRQNADDLLRNLPDLDPASYSTVRRVLSVISLSDSDYERYWVASRKACDLLRSSYNVRSNPEVY